MGVRVGVYVWGTCVGGVGSRCMGVYGVCVGGKVYTESDVEVIGVFSLPMESVRLYKDI